MSGDRESVQKSFQSGSLCKLDYLLVNVRRNQATIERLIGIFLESQPVLSSRLMDALQRDDRPALRDVLHEIRSSCVLFSAQECVELARDFELQVREGPVPLDSGEWGRMARQLCDYLGRMADELQVYLKQVRE